MTNFVENYFGENIEKMWEIADDKLHLNFLEVMIFDILEKFGMVFEDISESVHMMQEMDMLGTMDDFEVMEWEVIGHYISVVWHNRDYYKDYYQLTKHPDKIQHLVFVFQLWLL